MHRLLQSLLFNRRVYDRPHDKWICGRACDGCPCALGPDTKGNCRATGECLPAKRGDRWYCTRSETQGGPCTVGPLPDGACGRRVTPCVPQRSYRSMRGIWVWLTTATALGIVILALTSNGHTAWSSPGPLTAHHATSAQRCADCHLETGGLRLAPDAVARRRLDENQLCLKCHDLGPLSASPHGADLSPRTKFAGGATGERPIVLKLARLLVADKGQGELACATCHQEHHGRDFNLTRLTDQQCQTCHTTQFASFNSGHPEFASFPFTRRTRIQFDHASHVQKHFLEPALAAAAPRSCATCHETAADGGLMLVRGFEQTCAACHAGQIEGEGRAGAKGVPFFRLPGVDIATLNAAGQSVGEWPDYAEGDITPFMRWLLEGNAEDRAALALLDKLQLQDLSAATGDQKAAAGRIVWSIKNLFADLITQGQPVLLERMGGAGNSGMARTGQFSADGLLAAQQAWLPHLLAEVANHRAGKDPALPTRPTPSPSVPSSGAPAKTATPATGDLLANDDLLAEPARPAATPPLPATTDDLLADEPAAPAKSKSDDDLLAGDSAAPAPLAKKNAVEPPAMVMADTEQRAAAGGWYRQDETYTLLYRPTGHADPFLTAWLNTSANGQTPISRQIFAELTNPKAPGLCMKCHTVDEIKDRTVVNWHAARPDPSHHGLTSFKHTAHFSVAGDKGCQSCHAITAESDYASGFGGNRDPAVFHSNFTPITRNACASCHKPAVAGNSCLQCHNYHSGDFEPHMRIKADSIHPVTAAAK